MVLQMVVVVQKNMKLTHFFTLNNFCFFAGLPYPEGVLALGLPLAVVGPGHGPDGLLLYLEA